MNNVMGLYGGIGCAGNYGGGLQAQSQDQIGLLQANLIRCRVQGTDQCIPFDGKDPSFKEKLQSEVDEWLKPVRR